MLVLDIEYWKWRSRTIVVGGIEPLVVDKIMRIYIVIGGVGQFVDEKILSRYIGIGSIKALAVENVIACS